MKRKLLPAKILTSILLVVLVSSCQSPIVQEEDFIDDVALKSASIFKNSYIIQFDNSFSAELRELKDYKTKKEKVKGLALGLLKKHSITDGEIGYTYSNSIVGFSVKIAPGQAKKLATDKTIKSINIDKVITLAPPPGKGKPKDGGSGEEENLGQEIPWGISRVGGAGDGIGKRAWVIDTGIDLDHPDLNVNTSLGFSAFTKGKDASLDDGNGHGSHVAGTIAAKNNSIGVVGVAAGASVVPVKVLNSRGSGSYSGVIAGVDWVAANGTSGDVANMSLGGSVSNDLDDAVRNASSSSGVIFVLAAGNESDNANNHSPARANGNKIYTISAMNSSDNFASFSNYGNPPVDYCAPGVSIKSTYKNGGYATLNGTSMAAPHVAGIALLGSIATSGNVNGDPDGNNDPIASR